MVVAECRQARSDAALVSKLQGGTVQRPKVTLELHQASNNSLGPCRSPHSYPNPKTAPSFSWYMSSRRLRNGLRCSQWPRNVDRLASSLHLENGEGRDGLVDCNLLRTRRVCKTVGEQIISNSVTSHIFLGECKTNAIVEFWRILTWFILGPTGFNTWLQEDLKHQVSGQWTMPGTTRTTGTIPCTSMWKWSVWHFLAKRWAEAHQSFENNQPAKMVDSEQNWI